MPTPRFPRLRGLALGLLITATALWSPMMLWGMASHAEMGTMPGMEHPAGTSTGHPIECCALCPLTCAAPVVIVSAPAALPIPPRVVRIAASAARVTVPELLGTRRLPFPVGPPALRIA